MKRLLKPLLLVFLSCTPVFASSIVVGGPGDPFNGDCAPFGCAAEYQQVYGSGLFSGVIGITGLTFFNNNFVPGDIAPANYTISLSTTSASVNGLSSTFANNIGLDNTVFFNGSLGGPIGPTNQFTITGPSFTYDPSQGNLLLTITSNGSGLDFSVFLDFASGAPAGTFSRAYGFSGLGTADVLESDTGLVTAFTYTPQSTTPVPEPETLTLLTMGLSGLALKLLGEKRAAPASLTTK